MHNVFEYIQPKEENQTQPMKLLVALGSPLQVTDKPNQDIQDLLDNVKIELEKKPLVLIYLKIIFYIYRKKLIWEKFL